jgi:hypothetical protein
MEREKRTSKTNLANDWVTPTLAEAINNFLIGQDCSKRWAPIHCNLCLAQTFESQKMMPSTFTSTYEKKQENGPCCRSKVYISKAAV